MTDIFKQLNGSTILITGATGLIGSNIIRMLCSEAEDVSIIAPVRSAAKAAAMLGSMPHVRFIETDLATFDYASLNGSSHAGIDYIIHCAAPTASRYFVEHPVETYRSITDITARILEDALGMHIKGMVYLSSLEVYGTVTDDTEAVTEEKQGYIDPLSARSSYPMAKRAAECLCHLYASQHGLPVRIARLTQTTCGGIADDDHRIIAEFARHAARHEDITLHTAGGSARPYCHTEDAVSAILHILLKGENGQAYNVANEETYISARDMAMYVKTEFAPGICVRTELRSDMGYAPETRLRLSAARLRALGWQPKYGLHEIFSTLIGELG